MTSKKGRIILRHTLEHTIDIEHVDEELQRLLVPEPITPAKSLTPEQAAKELGVCRTTVINMCEDGRLEWFDAASPTASRRQRRITLDAIEQYRIEHRGQP